MSERIDYTPQYVGILSFSFKKTHPKLSPAKILSPAKLSVMVILSGVGGGVGWLGGGGGWVCVKLDISFTLVGLKPEYSESIERADWPKLHDMGVTVKMAQ